MISNSHATTAVADHAKQITSCLHEQAEQKKSQIISTSHAVSEHVRHTQERLSELTLNLHDQAEQKKLKFISTSKEGLEKAQLHLAELKRTQGEKIHEVQTQIMSFFAPTDELRTRFPDPSIPTDSLVRFEEYSCEDATKMGYTCGFCVSGVMTTVDVVACVGHDGSPMEKLDLHHPNIPASLSSIDLPVGQQDVPVPFFALPVTAMGMFGLIIDTQITLLGESDLQELREKQAKERRPRSAVVIDSVVNVASSAASNVMSTASSISHSLHTNKSETTTHNNDNSNDNSNNNDNDDKATAKKTFTMQGTMDWMKKSTIESSHLLAHKKEEFTKNVQESEHVMSMSLSLSHGKEGVSQQLHATLERSMGVGTIQSHLTTDQLKKGLMHSAEAVKSTVESGIHAIEDTIATATATATANATATSEQQQEEEEEEEHHHSWKDIMYVRVVLGLKGEISDGGLGLVSFCLPSPPIFLMEKVLPVNVNMNVNDKDIINVNVNASILQKKKDEFMKLLASQQQIHHCMEHASMQ